MPGGPDIESEVSFLIVTYENCDSTISRIADNIKCVSYRTGQGGWKEN